MKLKLINMNFQRYGFPLELKMPENFNGHQIGAAAGIIGQNGVVEKNFIDKTLFSSEFERNSVLKDLIKEDMVISRRCYKPIKEEDRIEICTIYYVPYMVRGHSMYMPTINNKNISAKKGQKHKISVEILLVPPDANEIKRYVTLTFETVNAPILSCVQEIFKKNISSYKDIFVPIKEDGKKIQYEVTFYDDVGVETTLRFMNTEHIYACITSARIVKFENI